MDFESGQTSKPGFALNASHRLRTCFPLVTVCLVFLLTRYSYAQQEPNHVSIDACPPELIELYLTMANYSKLAYHVPEHEMVVLPEGTAALVHRDQNNNLIIAFRGSVMPLSRSESKLDPIRGALYRLRSFQDWIETNVAQSLGHLPKQYVESAQLVIDQILKHPNVNRIFITGHSKGGGEAEFATAAAWLASDIPPQLKTRIMGITFNAAVVREMNWQRLYDYADDHLVDAYLQGYVPRVDAVIMCDDFVPKKDSLERHPRPFLNLVVIEPTEWLWAVEQHSIAVVIDELERRLKKNNPRQPQPNQPPPR